MGKNRRSNFVDKLLYVLSMVAPTLALLWIVGMLIQWINGVKSQNLSFFLTYGQISLTLFGFTMISAIFEKNKEKSKELKELFYLSIIFLVSSISFFYLYFTSFLLINNKLIEWIYIISITISLIIAFSGFVLGLFLLLQILLKFSKRLQEVKSINSHSTLTSFKSVNLKTDFRKYKKLNKEQYCQYKPSIFSMYILPLITFLLGILFSYYFTTYGYNLSFPDYPHLLIDYSSKNLIYVESFSKDNLPKTFFNNKNINPYALNVSFRLINKGRPDIKELILSLWGENLYYPTQLIGPIKGKNGFIDITLPLVYWCKNNSKECNLDSIPLGRKVVNIYVYCEECGVKLNNYPVEFCIFDNINITQGKCIEELKFFPN